MARKTLLCKVIEFIGELCSYIEYIIDSCLYVKLDDEPDAADVQYYDELDDNLDTRYIDGLQKLFADYIIK